MQLAGHVVLVTGGASGIGFALARRFVEGGSRVIIVGRTEAKLAAAQRALPGVDTCLADVAAPGACARIVEAHPDVSILVNNAGIQNIMPVLASSAEQIEQELRVNFLAPALLCRAYLPRLLQRESAAIVNVSSGLALVPKQSAAVYCASKAALHSFSKTLRWQLEGTSVKLFEVLPPVVDTPMTAGRGRAKITPEQLADEFCRGFARDRFEMRIGLTKVFAFAHRFLPAFVEARVRRGE